MEQKPYDPQCIKWWLSGTLQKKFVTPDWFYNAHPRGTWNLLKSCWFLLSPASKEQFLWTVKQVIGQFAQNSKVRQHSGVCSIFSVAHWSLLSLISNRHCPVCAVVETDPFPLSGGPSPLSRSHVFHLLLTVFLEVLLHFQLLPNINGKYIDYHYQRQLKRMNIIIAY